MLDTSVTRTEHLEQIYIENIYPIAWTEVLRRGLLECHCYTLLIIQFPYLWLYRFLLGLVSGFISKRLIVNTFRFVKQELSYLEMSAFLWVVNCMDIGGMVFCFFGFKIRESIKS